MQPSLFCQRWRDHRSTYRPTGEPINTHEYEVAPIKRLEAKAFVEQHHYSRSFTSNRFRYGLFHRGQLAGAAVFGSAMRNEVLTNVFPGDVLESVELGRFVLLDIVPANGESWFLARCRELLKREGIRGIVAFSDDTPRATTLGHLVFPGHIGTIYQASNAAYLGRATKRTLRLFDDGTVFCERAQTKIRKRKQGWKYATQILVRYGATEPPSNDTELLAWFEFWLNELTRPLKHPGNHKYAWSLNRGFKVFSCYPYPKPTKALT